jgi:hypothetical protein
MLYFVKDKQKAAAWMYILPYAQFYGYVYYESYVEAKGWSWAERDVNVLFTLNGADLQLKMSY